ncbi:hypothetical protein [Paramuribaculum intestinale]|jgi:uncharacterized protein YfaS (alpha-2-macroglobulin family)|uniref:hypothetical protein n=1 Tax=Paramuribaculum intestinale TaxID=2094151 RepID=UPI000F48DD71|nr:hypothetical protein [Paramuribaculum intestinale]ROT17132.1 hypothetical protein EEL50_00900 [Muribaculaceae bacterium Isolate-105 (HZI)]RXE61937.1 hypothetical protein ED375_07730 [Muribaculaceae bacterium Isolate-004 (NCI)]
MIPHIRTFTLLTTLTAILIATSCSSDDTRRFDDELRQADMAVAEGDMTAATSIARRLSDEHLDAMTAGQLCRLSILYMQLSDDGNQSENISRATDCYRKAFATDSDSARQYYSQLGPEQTANAQMLATIAGSIGTALPGEAETDTLPETIINDSHEH